LKIVGTIWRNCSEGKNCWSIRIIISFVHELYFLLRISMESQLSKTFPWFPKEINNASAALGCDVWLVHRPHSYINWSVSRRLSNERILSGPGSRKIQHSWILHRGDDF
jgi:hypothetical protein